MAPSRLTAEDELAVPEISYDINLPYKHESDEYDISAKGRTEFPHYLPSVSVLTSMLPCIQDCVTLASH
jgi:sulfonate dioxygenase